MILGIDVGGTYSDGVLIDGKKIIGQVKIKTNPDNLIQSIMDIKKNLNIIDSDLEKVIVSTTLMTNFIVEKRYKNTCLLLIPGPGMKYSNEVFPITFKIVSGGIDFQGRLIKNIDKEEVIKAVEAFIKDGINKISINCKFSPRNPTLEEETYNLIKQKYPQLSLEKGIDLTGNLNFIRRSVSSGLKIASEEVFKNFLNSLKEVFPEENILYILKSDGGFLPIEQSKNYSIDTIFSGPAASAFGASALMRDIDSAVVIDIGGTTSDFSLILNHEPLFASKGIKINDFYTTARGLSVYSLPLGGDTGVNINGNNFTFSMKKTIPVIDGGDTITISDCLCYLGETKIGNKDLLEGLLTRELSEAILNQAGKILADTLAEVIIYWEREPKYRVWQIENQMKIHPEILFLIGGPANALKKYVQKNMTIPVVSDERAMTANALGAALAEDSFNSYVRINTSEGTVSTGWGYFENKDFSKRIHPDEAANYALLITKARLKEKGIEKEPVIFEHEIFSIVRNGYTSGQIHEIEAGIKPAIRGGIEL